MNLCGQNYAAPKAIRPYLPRPTGFGSVSSPFFRGRLFTESRAQRDQSTSPRDPSSSRTRRWGFAHTLAFDHSAMHR